MKTPLGEQTIKTLDEIERTAIKLIDTLSRIDTENNEKDASEFAGIVDLVTGGKKDEARQLAQKLVSLRKAAGAHRRARWAMVEVSKRLTKVRVKEKALRGLDEKLLPAIGILDKSIEELKSVTSAVIAQFEEIKSRIAVLIVYTIVNTTGELNRWTIRNEVQTLWDEVVREAGADQIIHEVETFRKAKKS